MQHRYLCTYALGFHICRLNQLQVDSISVCTGYTDFLVTVSYLMQSNSGFNSFHLELGVYKPSEEFKVHRRMNEYCAIFIFL